MDQTDRNALDYESCRRVWRRVSPELDPYPEEKEATDCPAAAGGVLPGLRPVLSPGAGVGAGGDAALAAAAAAAVSSGGLRRPAIRSGRPKRGGPVPGGAVPGAEPGGGLPRPAAVRPAGAEYSCILRETLLQFRQIIPIQRSMCTHERMHHPGGGAGGAAEV